MEDLFAEPFICWLADQDWAKPRSLIRHLEKWLTADEKYFTSVWNRAWASQSWRWNVSTQRAERSQTPSFRTSTLTTPLTISMPCRSSSHEKCSPRARNITA